MSCHTVPVDHTFCGGCRVREEGLCAALEPRRLISALHPIRLMIPAGQDFPVGAAFQGAMFNIVDGWAVLHETFEDGRRQIVQVILPGDTISPPNDSTYMLTAITDVLACAVSQASVENATASEPTIARQVMSILRRERALAYRHQAMLGRRTAKERVAFFLLETFIRARRRRPQPGDTLKLPLTQFAIGDALGLTSIHVNRMLSELRHEGVLATHQSEITFLDPDTLFHEAAADPEVETWIETGTTGNVRPRLAGMMSSREPVPGHVTVQ